MSRIKGAKWIIELDVAKQFDSIRVAPLIEEFIALNVPQAIGGYVQGALLSGNHMREEDLIKQLQDGVKETA